MIKRSRNIQRKENKDEKVLGTLTKVEQVIMVATFAIMVASSFAQVVNRNIFKLPIAWFDEASTYCMIYMALIGTEIGLRDGTQIAVTAVVDKLHGAGKKIVQIASKIVVLIFSVSVLIAAVNMVNQQIVTGQTSAALHLPMAVPYAALVISFAMIVIVQGLLMIGMIIDFVKGKMKRRKHNGNRITIIWFNGIVSDHRCSDCICFRSSRLDNNCI